MATTTKPKLIPMCLKCDTMHYFCECYGGLTMRYLELAIAAMARKV